MHIPDATVAAYQTEGVAVLRGVFVDWVSALAQGTAEVMSSPSARERTYRPQDGSPVFFQNFCNWQRIGLTGLSTPDP